jgi:hypothetical protein
MSPWRYPRLGLPMIGAALAAAGHDVLIYNPLLAPTTPGAGGSCSAGRAIGATGGTSPISCESSHGRNCKRGRPRRSRPVAA